MRLHVICGQRLHRQQLVMLGARFVILRLQKNTTGVKEFLAGLALQIFDCPQGV